MRAFFSKAFLIAIGVTVVSTPANADKGGGYIGVSAGYGWTDAKAETAAILTPDGYFIASSIPAIETAGRQSVKPRGVIGGFDVGYDLRSGNLVYGVAADFSILDGSDSASTTTPYPCCAPLGFTIKQSVKTKWMTTVRARVGYDIGGATIYATGGYAGLKARYTATFTDNYWPVFEQGSTSKYRSGWVIGAGADIKVGGRFSVQPEFLHADFGRIKAPQGDFLADGSPDAFPNTILTHRAAIKVNIARVGLHLHF